MAAGLACAYNAPLGAALFALEIVFGSLALDLFAPLAVASGTATLLTWGAFGNLPTFTVPSLRMTSAWEIVAFALLALRLIVTPLAVGSGTVGGVFTPTLFLGAMLGQAFGSSIRAVVPGSGLDPAAYALVGMSTVLAGTTHAPLTSAVLVFEMTLDYSAIVPLLVGSAIANQVATLLTRESVYTEALNRKALAARMPGGPAELLRVSDVMRQDQITVPADMRLQPLLDTFIRARRNHVYLVDADGRFRGAVNFHETVGALQSTGGAGSTTAQDLAHAGFPVARLDDALADALERFDTLAAERLPVLEAGSSRRLVGTISKRDILAAYSARLLTDTGVSGS
jgi:CIC family chloride channel protein